MAWIPKSPDDLRGPFADGEEPGTIRVPAIYRTASGAERESVVPLPSRLRAKYEHVVLRKGLHIEGAETRAGGDTIIVTLTWTPTHTFIAGHWAFFDYDSEVVEEPQVGEAIVALVERFSPKRFDMWLVKRNDELHGYHEYR